MEMTLDPPEESKIARFQIKGRELRKISKDAGNKKKQTQQIRDVSKTTAKSKGLKSLNLTQRTKYRSCSSPGYAFYKHLPAQS